MGSLEIRKMVAFLKRMDSGLATGDSRRASRASDFQIMGASRLCRGVRCVHEKGMRGRDDVRLRRFSHKGTKPQRRRFLQKETEGTKRDRVAQGRGEKKFRFAGQVRYNRGFVSGTAWQSRRCGKRTELNRDCMSDW